MFEASLWPGKEFWGQFFLQNIHGLPINMSHNKKKTAPKKAKNLLKTAISAGRQSHPQIGEQAVNHSVKCLEPPCSQEKTYRDNFFANKFESQQKTAPKKVKNLLKTAGNLIIEMGGKHFTPPLFAITTAYCVPRQIPVKNMNEHSREICSVNKRLAQVYFTDLDKCFTR